MSKMHSPNAIFLVVFFLISTGALAEENQGYRAISLECPKGKTDSLEAKSARRDGAVAWLIYIAGEKGSVEVRYKAPGDVFKTEFRETLAVMSSDPDKETVNRAKKLVEQSLKLERSICLGTSSVQTRYEEILARNAENLGIVRTDDLKSKY